MTVEMRKRVLIRKKEEDFDVKSFPKHWGKHISWSRLALFLHLTFIHSFTRIQLAFKI